MLFLDFGIGRIVQCRNDSTLDRRLGSNSRGEPWTRLAGGSMEKTATGARLF